MTRQNINIGINANDGTGDDLRSAMQKVNDNFAELYSATTPVSKTKAQLTGGYTAASGTIVSVSDMSYKPAYYTGSAWRYVVDDSTVV